MKKLSIQKIEMNKTINPLGSLLFLTLTALLAVFFHLPQTTTLIIIGVYFFIIAGLHPQNGIYFLLLILPFFLGNSKRPYYIILEFFVYALIVSFLIYMFFSKRERIKIPYFHLISIFFIFSLLSLPVNLKEFYFEVKGSLSIDARAYLIELGKMFCSSHEGTNAYWLRSFANLLSSIFLYLVTVYFFQGKDDILKSYFPLAIVFVITLIFGYCFLYDVIPHRDTYLSLSLVGKHDNAMTAFAYNRGYLGEYLIIVFPFIAYYLSKFNEKKTAFVFSVVILIIFLFTLPLTKQRGALLAFLFQIIFLFFIFWSESQYRWKVVTVGGILFIISLAFLFLGDYILRDGILIDRILNSKKDPGLRPEQWKVAWSMFKAYPLLGVGLGKHHHFFKEFSLALGHSWDPKLDYFGIRFVRTTAHNLYLHLLAEQGFLGLFSFLLIIVTIFIDSFRKMKLMKREEKYVAITIIISLVGWLSYGMAEHMFYLRIMQIFFWIELGFLSVLLRPYLKPIKFPRRLWGYIGVVSGILLVYRLALAYIYFVP